MEIKREPICEVKDDGEHRTPRATSKSTVKPSLSFIIAKTIINNPDGMTTREISAHIMQTYSRFRSVDLNVFVKSVGSDISRSKFYYKKSKSSKNIHLWAVLPKYESYLREMTGTYRKSWKEPHKSKNRRRKSKPTVINNCVASLELCEDIKTEEPDEEYNPINSEDNAAIISQFNEMNCNDENFQDILNYLQLQFNPQEEDSGMCISEQENADAQSGYSNHYMNQNCSEQITNAFTSATTNNIDHTTMQDDHPSVLEEIKFINIPVNTTSENINTPMNTSEIHSVDDQNEMLFCPMCKFPFFTYEDLGKHVHCEHTDGEISSSANQNGGVLREVLSNLMTAFKNLKSNTPIELCIVTGNQNVHLTADPEKQGRTFS